MPRAQLPTSPVGWIVALGASFLGFIVGFVAIALAGKVIG